MPLTVVDILLQTAAECCLCWCDFRRGYYSRHGGHLRQVPLLVDRCLPVLLVRLQGDQHILFRVKTLGL